MKKNGKQRTLVLLLIHANILTHANILWAKPARPKFHEPTSATQPITPMPKFYEPTPPAPTTLPTNSRYSHHPRQPRFLRN